MVTNILFQNSESCQHNARHIDLSQPPPTASSYDTGNSCQHCSGFNRESARQRTLAAGNAHFLTGTLATSLPHCSYRLGSISRPRRRVKDQVENAILPLYLLLLVLKGAGEQTVTIKKPGGSRALAVLLACRPRQLSSTDS